MERLRYRFEDFMKYKNVNDEMIQQLIPYIDKEQNPIQITLEHYKMEMENIISSIIRGDNPNDVILRNQIKFYINTINKNNFNEYVIKIKQINFSSLHNIDFLIMEIIFCVIRCSIAFKGFDIKERQHSTIPEICADLSKELASCKIKINTEGKEQEIDFHMEFLKMCQIFFTQFMDNDKLMDEHNSQNSDNYKGFMTFLGLLYENNVISNGIIIKCIDTIIDTIFKNTDGICLRSQTECGNFYKGYEFLCRLIIEHLKKNQLNEKNKLFVNDLIKKHHEISEINKNIKAIDIKKQIVVPLRAYFILLHDELEVLFNELVKG
jgi:hypothetical protein